MARTKTVHSYFADKVALRAGHLPVDPVKVLDCYAGRGMVWAAVQKVTERKISVLPIDIADYGVFHLPGDNRAYLDSIDLSRFNVIDLDVYGVPYEQLRSIFNRGFDGTVFVTFVQTIVGVMNRGLLYEVGFTEDMVKKIRTLFFRRGWQYFLDWLAMNGVEQIWHRSKDRKHYLAFQLEKAG